MRYNLAVPFRLGQAVYQATYAYKAEWGEENYIITDWTVAGYNLTEEGQFYIICKRLQGDLYRIEHVSAENLFATEEAAKECLKMRWLLNCGKTIPQSAEPTAPFTQGSLLGDDDG